MDYQLLYGVDEEAALAFRAAQIAGTKLPEWAQLTDEQRGVWAMQCSRARFEDRKERIGLASSFVIAVAPSWNGTGTQIAEWALEAAERLLR